MKVRALAFSVVVVAAASIGAARGDASFPGRNGVLVCEQFIPRADNAKVNGLFLASTTVLVPGNKAPPRTAWRKVPRTTALDREPAWAPDGRTLAYVHLPKLNAKRATIRTVRSSGRGRRSLIANTNRVQPSWSANGRLVAFVRDGSVWVKEIGGAERRLARGTNPAFAPIGTDIAYDRGGRVYEIDAAGGDERQFDFSSLADKGFSDPAWSPDGRYLLVRWSGLPDLIVIDDTVTNTAVTINDGRNSTWPYPSPGGVTWSPDGKRLAFVDSDVLTFMTLRNDTNGATGARFVGSIRTSSVGCTGAVDWQRLR